MPLPSRKTCRKRGGATWKSRAVQATKVALGLGALAGATYLGHKYLKNNKNKSAKRKSSKRKSVKHKIVNIPTNVVNIPTDIENVLTENRNINIPTDFEAAFDENRNYGIKRNRSRKRNQPFIEIDKDEVNEIKNMKKLMEDMDNNMKRWRAKDEELKLKKINAANLAKIIPINQQYFKTKTDKNDENVFISNRNNAEFILPPTPNYSMFKWK